MSNYQLRQTGFESYIGVVGGAVVTQQGLWLELELQLEKNRFWKPEMQKSGVTLFLKEEIPRSLTVTGGEISGKKKRMVYDKKMNSGIYKGGDKMIKYHLWLELGQSSLLDEN